MNHLLEEVQRPGSGKPPRGRTRMAAGRLYTRPATHTSSVALTGGFSQPQSSVRNSPQRPGRSVEVLPVGKLRTFMVVARQTAML